MSPPAKFSGASAEQLKKAYSEFCSKHTKAVKEYKDLLARDKRFQQFIRVSAHPRTAPEAPLGWVSGSPCGVWALCPAERLFCQLCASVSPTVCLPNAS